MNAFYQVLIFAVLGLSCVLGQSMPIPGCPTVGSPHKLSPSVSVFAPDTQFSNNLLVVVVAVPSIYNTFDVDFYYSQPSCPFNGNRGWVRKADPNPSKCMTYYTNAAPWDQVVQSCGFNRTNSGTFVLFDGHFNAKTTEQDEDDDGHYFIRETDTALQVGVQFSTQYSASLVIVDMSLNFTTWEITKIAIDQNIPPDASMTVEFNTIWPLILLNPRVTSAPSDIPTSVQLVSSNCPDSANYPACIEDIVLTFNPSVNRCNLNGTYTVTFDVACQPNAPKGYCNTYTTQVISILAITEDYCSSPTTFVNVLASLASYSDPKYSKNTPYFLQDSTVYLELEGSSPDNPGAVTAVTPANVTLFFIGAGTSIPLYVNGIATSAGVQTSIQVTNSGPSGFPNIAFITFVLDETLIPVNRKSYVTIDIEVDTFVIVDGVKQMNSVFARSLASSSTPMPFSPTTAVYLQFPNSPSSPSDPSSPSSPSGSPSGSTTGNNHSNAGFIFFASIFSSLFPAITSLYLLL